MMIDEPIAAIATPPGRGGIGIVRVSGSGSLSVMKRFFMPRRPVERFEPLRLYYGDILDIKSNIIDTGYAVFMKAPHSFTGEDTVEFHCHGSPAVLSRLMVSLQEYGIRQAFPGEFTRRAFLNGKMDLLQAEALLDLVNSTGEQRSTVALSQLKGDLTKRIRELKDSLVALLSQIDAIIDFPESVDNRVDIDFIQGSLNNLLTEIDGLISTYRVGRVLKDGIMLQLIGLPNAGKSSLFNALLGRERAIVHHSPGTTRDYIEEELPLNGRVLRIMDTAGLYEPKDELDMEGMKRAIALSETTDAFIFVIDLTRYEKGMVDKIAELICNKPGIIALNKIDLVPEGGKKVQIDKLSGWKKIETSAKTLKGIDELKGAIAELVDALTPSFEPVIITRLRHKDCLERAFKEVLSAKDEIASSGNIVIVSDLLRRAMRALGELTGENLDEELLDKIFSEFCVGK